MIKISRALISVSDKTGLVDFAKLLSDYGVEIVSTGGTAKALRDAGISVVDISNYTGFPEILDGRVKTLHPTVHGGLLYVRGKEEHERQVAEHQIQPIDLVVVNLYPFEKTVTQPNVTHEEAVENIDIGGPSMLRSAAKNYRFVTVVVDPSDYRRVVEDIQNCDGSVSECLRAELAVKVFEHTSKYDHAIAEYLSRHQIPNNPTLPRIGSNNNVLGETSLLPKRLTFQLVKSQDLRYGENPHQQAALYGDFLNQFKQIHGKELSYNNILDLSAAAELVNEFEDPTIAIIKHTNPCGVGSALTLVQAWEGAFATDRQSPFGGIIASNKKLDKGTAQAIAEIFSEVIVAPDFDSDALEILQKKKNLRLIRMQATGNQNVPSLAYRSVQCGMLVQERDVKQVSRDQLKCVTKRPPSENEFHAMMFAWRIVKHVKSNAIVYARSGAESVQTIGVGAGQMSRVDSSRIAVMKAKEAGLSLEGSVIASDAFFPFADGIITAVEAGATAIIQPGGSIRDAEVIKVADERNIAMVFTGVRHFRH